LFGNWCRAPAQRALYTNFQTALLIADRDGLSSTHPPKITPDYKGHRIFLDKSILSCGEVGISVRISPLIFIDFYRNSADRLNRHFFVAQGKLSTELTAPNIDEAVN
jgi:hypothetical protein